LHDLLHAEGRQAAGQASFAKAKIFGPIGAVDDPVAHDLRGEVVGGGSLRRGETGPGVTPKQAMSCERLHASTDCMSASMNWRMSRIRVCTAAVSGGIRPSGGSTMSDVRGPIGREVSMGSASNVMSYAPVRSSRVPRGAMRSPRFGALAA
jgi:hypothetical protein